MNPTQKFLVRSIVCGLQLARDAKQIGFNLHFRVQMNNVGRAATQLIEDRAIHGGYGGFEILAAAIYWAFFQQNLAEITDEQLVKMHTVVEKMLNEPQLTDEAAIDHCLALETAGWVVTPRSVFNDSNANVARQS